VDANLLGSDLGSMSTGCVRLRERADVERLDVARQRDRG
jgi:hypothetical protein